MPTTKPDMLRKRLLKDWGLCLIELTSPSDLSFLVRISMKSNFKENLERKDSENYAKRKNSASKM